MHFVKLSQSVAHNQDIEIKIKQAGLEMYQDDTDEKTNGLQLLAKPIGLSSYTADVCWVSIAGWKIVNVSFPSFLAGAKGNLRDRL